MNRLLWLVERLFCLVSCRIERAAGFYTACENGVCPLAGKTNPTTANIHPKKEEI
jgi:hypothetical protein